MERFARAITGLGKISQDVLDAVIVEFLELLTTGPEIAGGNKAARKLLAAVLDEERGRAPARRRPRRHPQRLGAAERHARSPAIASFLAGRAPADRRGDPERDARRGGGERARAARARLRPVHRAAARRGCRPSTRRSLAAIQGAIERDFLSVLQRNLSKRRPADLIAGLMNNISTEVREGFLGYLEAQEPALAQDVQRTMFTFDDIAVRLHGRDVAGVLRDVPEETLLKALKLGQMQGSATVAFILENLPRRLSERYVEELAALADVTPQGRRGGADRDHQGDPGAGQGRDPLHREGSPSSADRAAGAGALPAGRHRS